MAEYQHLTARGCRVPRGKTRWGSGISKTRGLNYRIYIKSRSPGVAGYIDVEIYFLMWFQFKPSRALRGWCRVSIKGARHARFELERMPPDYYRVRGLRSTIIILFPITYSGWCTLRTWHRYAQSSRHLISPNNNNMRVYRVFGNYYWIEERFPNKYIGLF